MLLTTQIMTFPKKGCLRLTLDLFVLLRGYRFWFPMRLLSFTISDWRYFPIGWRIPYGFNYTSITPLKMIYSAPDMWYYRWYKIMPSSFADKWLLVNCIGTVGRKVIMYSESYALFLLISFFVCILVVPAVICTQACTMYVYNSIRIHIPLSSMFILLVSDRQSHVMFRHWVSCHPDVIAIMGSFFPREVGS